MLIARKQTRKELRRLHPLLFTLNAMPRKSKPAASIPLLSRPLSDVDSILGIDPSLTSTGLCVIDHHGALIESTTLGSKKTGPARLVELRDALDAYFKQTMPTVCALEGYSFGSKHAREAVAEWGGLIRVLLYEWKIPTLIVPPMTLKKFVLPSAGSLQKNRIALESYKRWNVSFQTDDECDAHALAQLALMRSMIDSLGYDSTTICYRMSAAASTAAVLSIP
jgi:Holliday junction resolvasome RuvABC endonuclease subunit